MTKTLSVAAIKNGTVIDHITAGQALKIIKLLKVCNDSYPITLGLNLPSQTMGKKDIIKLENFHLTEQKAHEVSLFAPEATINLIKDFKVSKKIQTHLPEMIKDILTCPNTHCITRSAHITSTFYVQNYTKKINLMCHYCEKIIALDNLLDYSL